MNKNIIEAAGWLGVAAILTAYGLNIFAVVAPDSAIYLALNVFGALGIITSSGFKRDYQPIFLNVVWLTFALIAIIR